MQNDKQERKINPHNKAIKELHRQGIISVRIILIKLLSHYCKQFNSQRFLVSTPYKEVALAAIIEPSLKLNCLSRFHEIQNLMETERLNALGFSKATLPRDIQNNILSEVRELELRFH